MEYKKLNNGSIALKISIGEKIRESLTKLVADEAIKFAKIEGVGAIENVTLGFLQENGEYKTKEFKEELELLSMKGSIAGDGEIHLHVTLGKKDFSVIGGHFFEGEVIGVGEIFITILSDQSILKKQTGKDKFPTWQLK